jgi:hypothetical protein
MDKDWMFFKRIIEEADRYWICFLGYGFTKTYWTPDSYRD